MDLSVSKHKQRETAEFLRNTELYVKSITNGVVSFLAGEQRFSTKGRKSFGKLLTARPLLYCS